MTRSMMPPTGFRVNEVVSEWLVTLTSEIPRGRIANIDNFLRTEPNARVWSFSLNR